MHITTLNLSIKREFLDAISKGLKTIEYRKKSEYYDKMFRDLKFDKDHSVRARFHYYKKPCLVVEVRRIYLIPTPKRILEHVPTERCYALQLGEIHSRLEC